MSGTRVRLWTLAFVVGAVALGGCKRGPTWPAEPWAAQNAANAQSTATQSSGPALHVELPDFAALVQTYGGAIVNVTVVQAPAIVRSPWSSAEDPLYEFFRRFGIPLPFEEQPGTPTRGMGSGFIVSPDGYILTNSHVVSDATEVTVKLIDRREFSAKVIGIDARSDVAVLKIEADKLPVVKFGDPHQLKPGQWVVAIGAPFGFENSVTVGVVSGTARSLPGNDYVPFIQTDVAVNPGNSGGPLFNLEGEVVGINSQIVSRSGGYMGLSFAIPIDVARNVEQQLISTGRVQRGRIGVAVQDMNAQFAESFGLDRARGALVSAVEPGGPGDKAGIRPGDVILQVNGQDVERSNELPTLIAGLKPGATAILGTWRNREAIEVQVRVAELKEARTRTRTRSEAEESGLLGLSVRPLTAEEREATETRGTLVVTDVFGAAALAGVQPGDIVLAVNGNPVKTVAELRAGIKVGGRVVALLIQRGDAQIFVPIPIEGSAG